VIGSLVTKVDQDPVAHVFRTVSATHAPAASPTLGIGLAPRAASRCAALSRAKVMVATLGQNPF
jgi:hypothetical protein